MLEGYSLDDINDLKQAFEQISVLMKNDQFVLDNGYDILNTENTVGTTIVKNQNIVNMLSSQREKLDFIADFLMANINRKVITVDRLKEVYDTIYYIMNSVISDYTRNLKLLDYQGL